jgi:hypothetical protein
MKAIKGRKNITKSDRGVKIVKNHLAKVRKNLKANKTRANTRNALIGQMGEHAVFAELINQGFLPEMANERQEFYDLSVTNPDNPEKRVLIQVKTRNSSSGWRVGGEKKIVRLSDSPIDLLFIFVDPQETGFEYYFFNKKQALDIIIDFAEIYHSTPKSGGDNKKIENVAWTFEGQRILYKEQMEEAKNNWPLIWKKLAL